MTSISEIEKLLGELEHQHFYGTVELKFESGHVVLIRKTETIKPENCRDNRGNRNEPLNTK